jgi:hypothetical protein
MKRESSAPLIVSVVLLLLPVVYVGSYLALVTPNSSLWDGANYRSCPKVCAVVFWPLEQADRKIRPNAWAGWHF